MIRDGYPVDVDVDTGLAGRRFTDGINLGVLTRIFHRDLVDEVLAAAGRQERRSRLLPARVVVYYVLALCLFFEDSYEEVMRKLVNGLRFLSIWRDEWHVPTDGAISQARTRLGEQPLKALFEQVAQPLAVAGTTGAWFHGWRVMAVYGVIVDVPNTEKNRAEFGKKRHHKDGESPFPQVRIVGLAECGTHAVIAAAFDSWRVQERELFGRFLDHLEPGMLVLADRGFYSYDMWTTVRDSGVELVWRIKDDINLDNLGWLPDGSYRSELIPAELKADLKKGLRQSIPDEVRIPVRVIEYMVANRKEGERELIRLITSIADHELAPAIELAALYHDRWEFELTLDEIETHQMP